MFTYLYVIAGFPLGHLSHLRSSYGLAGLNIQPRKGKMPYSFMDLLKKYIPRAKQLLFMDIEGTQFSHEVIEIGAALCAVDEDKNLIGEEPLGTFRQFCLARESVGPVVTQLTGITDERIKKEGHSFEAVMRDLNRLIGNLGSSLAVVVFGNQDSLMLGNSFNRSDKGPFLSSFVPYLRKHIFDYSEFISRFVRDDNGQTLSLLHLLDLFEVPACGIAHDPLNDALNLMNLYRAASRSPAVLKDEYKKKILSANVTMNNDYLVKKYLRLLLEGQDVKASDFDRDIEKIFE